ncbi:MAG: hypothetical protein R6X25_02570, partial [Candidatus Krumholzibacteriia bacterium]
MLRLRVPSPPAPTAGNLVLPTALGILLATALFLPADPVRAAWEYGDSAWIFESQNLEELAAAPDGRGGMLLAAVDRDLQPERILLSRVDHTGTELWGPSGMILPFPLDMPRQAGPLDLASAPDGGAYCAYTVSNTTDTCLEVARISAAGQFQWSYRLDNLGTAALVLSLVPTETGGVIVVWVRQQPSPELYAVRLNDAHGIDWQGPVNASYGGGILCRAEPDGHDGALVAFVRDDTPYGTMSVQRLASSNGARMWGSDGVLVWTGMGHGISLVGDGGGGVYVATSWMGQAWAQHVDGAGAITWASGGVMVHDSHTPYYNLDTDPKLCTAGSGGFYLLHGLFDEFVQRVAPNGTVPWGAAGVQVQSSAYPEGRPRIDADGQGGAVMVFPNSYDASPGVACRTVWAKRIDAHGTILWDRYVASCEYGILPGGSAQIMDAPRRPAAVGDGSGGAMVAWLLEDGSDFVAVRARGLGADGNAPVPYLSLLVPDAGEPGETGPYLISGDYLDLTLGYRLVNTGGPATIALAPTDLHSYQLVGGTGDLTGAEIGAYHLILDQGGTPADTLLYAFGVGPRPLCGDDAALPGNPRQVGAFGSCRWSAYDHQGDFHAVWPEYDPATGESRVGRAFRDPDGIWHTQPAIGSFAAPSFVRDPALAFGPGDQFYLAFVMQGSISDVLYLTRYEGGVWQDTRSWSMTGSIRNPVLAATEDGLVDVFFEQEAAGVTRIYHVWLDGSTPGGPTLQVDLGSPRFPDVAVVDGNDLVLVHVRDSILPGVEQVEVHRRVNGAWQPSRALQFGSAIRSPSVAGHTGDRVVVAWVLDNSVWGGSAGLV